MMHTTRRFLVTEFTSLEEVAHKLYEFSWTLCTGFKLGSILLLNDATSEDGAQEYAVIRDGRQVESLTVSWMESEASVLRALQRLREEPSLDIDMGPVEVRTHPHGETCRHCA